MGSFPKDELAQRSSLVALLFRLERRHSPEELEELVHEVNDWFRQHEGYERLQGLFTELIREACATRGMSLAGFRNMLEVKSMLSETIEGWKNQWLAEGEAKGKAEGKAEALISLLTGRFGTVAPPWQKRIRAAELGTLEHWIERAIVAPDLPSVFNSPG